MDRSTRNQAIRGVAGNLAALTIATVTLYVAMLMGIRWAAFGLITIGVFITGYTLSYCLLWLGLRGRALRVAAFLTAPLWLLAGGIVALAAYDTPVRCGPAFGEQPFAEVAGAQLDEAWGRGLGDLCLPKGKDVAATLLARLQRG
ncbi:MAG: hypothetical protein AAGK37_06340 [Pseudomonadota bacterium]